MTPKISIITITFNSQATLKDTLDSILLQNYPHIEHILVDGLSQDSTLQIAYDYQKQFIKRGIASKIISEKDKGIYDAMNKGIALASGEVIGFLNSDDFFASSSSLSCIAQGIQQVDCVFGQIALIDENKKIKRIWFKNPYSPLAFILGWHPAHPSFYVKREIFEKLGGFDLQYKIAGDYELMLRFLHKYKISSAYIPHQLVKMRLGGTSNANIKNIVKANWECFRAWKNNHLSCFPIFVAIKPIRKALHAFWQKITPPPKTNFAPQSLIPLNFFSHFKNNLFKPLSTSTHKLCIGVWQ